MALGGKGKVFVIGLDGATFEVIRPLVAAGRMPNLARLMREGAHGNLQSTVPPVTALAWPSMLTGTNPGKHGMFDFIGSRPGDYAISSYGNESLKVKTLWRLLSDAGKNVIAVDIPMTYPPEKVNGVMISGLGTPNTGTGFVYPPELKADVLGKFGAYKIDLETLDTKNNPENISNLLRDARALVDQRKKLCLYLMQGNAWDLCMVVFTATDRVQHALWRFHDPTHSDYASFEGAYKNAVNDFFSYADEAIGELVGSLDEQTSVLIVSDHGHGPTYRALYVNKWLTDNGYLHLSKHNLVKNPFFKSKAPDAAPEGFSFAGKDNWSAEAKNGIVSLTVSELDSWAGLEHLLVGLDSGSRYVLTVKASGSTDGVYLEFQDLKNTADPFIRGDQRVATAPAEYSAVFTPCGTESLISIRTSTYCGNPAGTLLIHSISVREIDWDATRAYCPGSLGYLNINLRGREPKGIVNPGRDYEDLRDEIAGKLLNLRDAETGGKLVGSVFRREELYYGASLSSAPDLVYLPSEFAYTTDTGFSFAEESLVGPTKSNVTGGHRLEGILIAKGPAIKRGLRCEANITDIAPTILYLMGLPVPTYMDGAVLTGIIEEDNLASNPILFVEDEGAPVVDGIAAGESREGESEVISRLKRLGYLE